MSVTLTLHVTKRPSASLPSITLGDGGIADDCIVIQRGKVAWSGAAADAQDEVLRHYLGESAEVS
jgi:hypothetical protein